MSNSRATSCCAGAKLVWRSLSSQASRSASDQRIGTSIWPPPRREHSRSRSPPRSTTCGSGAPAANVFAVRKPRCLPPHLIHRPPFPCNSPRRPTTARELPCSSRPSASPAKGAPRNSSPNTARAPSASGTAATSRSASASRPSNSSSKSAIGSPRRPAPSRWRPLPFPGRPPRVPVRIGLKERELQRNIKAIGGQWDPNARLWYAPEAQVRKIGLANRIVRGRS